MRYLDATSFSSRAHRAVAAARRSATALLAATPLLYACSGSGSHHVPESYARDLDRICHAERHSGALDEEPGQRQMIVAQWLAQNLETKEARRLLGEVAALAPAQKVLRLRSESKKAGITQCDLADSWNG